MNQNSRLPLIRRSNARIAENITKKPQKPAGTIAVSAFIQSTLTF
jgi:hypothetical protein